MTLVCNSAANEWLGKVDRLRQLPQLMLQTAPVLLLFPPTSGPKSRPDGQPVRYDFTSGSVPSFCMANNPTLIVLQATDSGTNTCVGYSPSCRRSQARNSSPIRLRSHHHRNYDHARPSLVHECSISVSASHIAKSESLGCFESDYHFTFYQRPHVQPYSEGTVRGRRREGWNFLLRWRLLQSVWHGDTDCSGNV